jgi:hypothetical protein
MTHIILQQEKKTEMIVRKPHSWQGLIPWIEAGNMLGKFIHLLMPNVASNIVTINKLFL